MTKCTFFVGPTGTSRGTPASSSQISPPVVETPRRPHSSESSGSESACSIESEDTFAYTNPNEKKLVQDNVSKCNLLINEILPSAAGSNTDTQYIEITERCGRKARLKSSSKIEGVVLLAVSTYESSPSVTSNLLSGRILFSTEISGTFNVNPGSGRTDDKFYIVVGNGAAGQGVFYKTIDATVSQPPYAGHIPTESDAPVALILLKFLPKEQPSLNKLLFTVATQLQGYVTVTSELQNIIQSHLIDMVVYGKRLRDRDVEFFRGLYARFPSFIETFMISSEATNSRGISNSLSRCALHNAPFAVSSFKKTSQTPGQKNDCLKTNSLEDLIYPYKFQHTNSFQHTAMHLILNCEYAASKIDAYPEILEGNPREVTSKLLGVGLTSLWRINRKEQQNAILTPKKRLRKAPVFTTIDSFDRDFITREIQKEYIRGVAPDAKTIYDKFMNYKKADTSASQPNPVSFRCSFSTFKRVLVNMGYKYQKIDDRAAVLQRYDLTRWRGRFIKTIKENEEKPTQSQKKVIYIDETWVDTNGRIAKGWAPKTYARFKDMAAFSYSNHKIGRGPRLIVLAAVSEEGVIPGSVLVYKVTSALTAEDYHKNVGKEEFTKWFDNLAKILKEKGGQYMVVMDNASYHSAKSTPKRADKKEVVYKYIEQQVQLKRVDVTLRPMKQMRRWELDIILDNIVKLPQMQKYLYELDQRAEKSGIDIVRLPPYHCQFNPIEFVWKDIKLNIRKQNTEQKIDSMKPIVEKELRSYGADRIAGHWRHVKNLRDRTWEEDNYFENVQDAIVINPNGDDEEDYVESEEPNNEADFEDDVPYADDVWIMQDAIDLEGEVFTEENELLRFMEQRPKPKKRRACARTLEFHQDD